MAVMLGGITSKPSGKVSGVVFGRARTRYGKLATAREYTIPTDPNTADQQERRIIFKLASLQGGLCGSELYQDAWNNTLGLLPGWNSMVGYFADNIELDTLYQWKDTLAPKSLGPVYMPAIADGSAASAGDVKVTWDQTVVGDHAALTDPLFGFISAKLAPGTGSSTSFARTLGTVTRDDEAITFTGLTGGTDYSVFLWFRHTEVDLTYTYSPIATIEITATS